MEDYEKKYEEALENIKRIKAANKDNKELVDFIEYQYPELKESEDEKIRKELILLFQDCVNNRNHPYNASDGKRWLSWLEKQGNKLHEEKVVKAMREIEEKARAFSNKHKGESSNEILAQMRGEQKPTEYTLKDAADIFLDALSKTPYNNKPITDAQVITRELLKFLSDARSYNPDALNEQKSEELPNGEDYGIDSLYHAARILEKTLGEVEGYESDDGILEHKCAIEAVKRLYKQKSAWSEEDENAIKVLMNIIKKSEIIDSIIYTDSLKEKLYDWLKSLKERVQTQPKQNRKLC